MQQLWQNAHAGFQVALLSGAAGMGKTHTTNAFAAGTLLTSGVCVTVMPGPFLPGLLESLFGYLKAEHHPEFLSFARAVTPHLPWAKVVTPRPAQASSAWTAVHRLALKERRLCLVIDDVHDWKKDHWEQLYEFARFLRARNAPVLLILTARDGDDVLQRWQRLRDWLAVTAGPAPEHFRLQPLSAAEVQELAQTELGTRLEPHGLTHWLTLHGHGHPLHTLLLLRKLRRDGALLDLGVTWDFRIEHARHDDVIERLLESELAALPHPLDASVLRALSVAGEALTRTQLQRALRVDAALLDACLARLASRYVDAVGAGAYRFRHPLLEATVRRCISWDEGRELARNLLPLVRTAASRARLARLAEHPQQAQWNREALDQALTRRQSSDVAEFATHLLHDSPEDASLRRVLWEAWADLGEYGAIIEHGATGDPACDVLLAHALETQGEYEHALRVLDGIRDDGTHRWKLLQRKLWCLEFLEAPERIVAELERYEGEEHHVLAWAWAEYECTRGNQEARITHMRRALELLPDGASPVERGVIEGNLGAALVNTGTFDEAERHLRRAVELFEQVGHTYALLGCEINLAYLSLTQGNYREAYRQNLRLYGMTDRLGDARLMSGVLANAATCEVWMGLPEQAIPNLEKSMQLYDGYEAANATDLAHAQALAGQLDAARATLATPDHHPLPRHVLLRARTHVLLGETERAREVLASSTQHVGVNAARERLLLAWTHLHDGNAAEALQHLHSAERALGDLDHPSTREEAALLRTLASGASHASVHAHVERLRELSALGHILPYRQQQPALFQFEETETEAAGGVFIETLGAFGLARNGEMVPWKGRKTRDLLALLLTAQLSNDPISRHDLLLHLWPDLPEQKAEHNLRKTMERLRQICGEALSVARHASGKYTLSSVHADVHFLVAGLDAHDLEQAFQWYHGPYLPGISFDSVLDLRDALHARLKTALLAAPEHHAPGRVLVWCEQYLKHEPFDVPVAQLALRQAALVGPDQRGRLHAALTSRFEKEWGFVPEELHAHV